MIVRLTILWTVLASSHFILGTSMEDLLLYRSNDLRDQVYRVADSSLPLNQSIFDQLKNFLTPLQGDINETCRADSQRYIDLLNSNTTLLTGNAWAYKMYDASAFLPPSGLLEGTFKFLGAFDSCKEVNAPAFTGKHCMIGFLPLDFTAQGRDIQHLENQFGRYRMQSLRHQSRINPEDIYQLLYAMSFARCIPSSCNETDLKTSLTHFFQDQGIFLDPQIYNCHTADEEIEIESADWVMIGIVVFFAILLVIGTIVDVSIKYLEAEFYSERFVQVFQGFSLYTNTVKLFTTDNVRPDSLHCINGIRFLSMTWVLFGHSYSQFQSGIPLKNSLTMSDPDGPIYGSVAFQAISNSYVSVDTFFFIGATLLAYLTIKELEKTKGGNVMFWIMYYVHRYIRLTGVYAIVIGLWATLLKFMTTGPTSGALLLESEACKESWWVNLLYVNNIIPLIQQGSVDKNPWCLGQTWYLANDMQFYLISPIFLVAFWYNPTVGLITSGLGLIGGTVAPMVVAYMNDFPFSPSFISITQGFDYMIEFYVVPWCRFQPYIMGIMFGYLLHTMRNQPKLKMNPYFVTWMWAIAGAIGAVVVYSLYPYGIEFVEAGGANIVGSEVERVAYNGLHRVAWSLSLGWVILACTKGVGGPINTILSWPFWIPLARLSYCIYLCHMTVITYSSSLMTFPVTFSHFLGVYFILAMLCLSIFGAYILSMLFEIPLAHIEKIIFAFVGIGKFPKAMKPPPKEEMLKHN